MRGKAIKNQKNQNKKVPIFIALSGILIGGILAGIGLIKKIDADKTNAARAESAKVEAEEKYNTANAQYKENAATLENLQAQMNAKVAECARLSGNYTKSAVCLNEKFNLQKEISSLESEQFQLENGNYTVYYSVVEPITYNIFFYIGGGVLAAALIASGIVYLVSNKRK